MSTHALAENHAQLTVQAEAARKVILLRRHGELVRLHLEAMRAADGSLRALLPQLSPAAAAEIDHALNEAADKLTPTFAALLNPADEPA